MVFMAFQGLKSSLLALFALTDRTVVVLAQGYFVILNTVIVLVIIIPFRDLSRVFEDQGLFLALSTY